MTQFLAEWALRSSILIVSGALRYPATVRAYQAPELPVLHPGPLGPLHRRDIYDDAYSAMALTNLG